MSLQSTLSSDASVAPLPASDSSAPQPAAIPGNPFFSASPLPYQLPPFDRIRNEDYAPAFVEGMRQQRLEIDAIAGHPEAPTFENTIVALERSGQLLNRVSRVFFNLTSAHTNPAMEAVQRDMAPRLAAHSDAIRLDGALFRRVRQLWERRAGLGLDAESLRLLERYRTDFVRAGAQLSEDDKTRLRQLNSELATLSTTFSQNVLRETTACAVRVAQREQLAGLPEEAVTAAAEAARARGDAEGYLLTLMNTSGQPAEAALTDRAMRQRLHATSVARGSRGGEFDNRDVVLRIAALRAERAQLLGYPNHAAYVLEDETAQTTDAVNRLLAELAEPAVANARREAADIQLEIARDHGDFEVGAADWAFYTEKVRQARYAFDAGALRPYLELDSVLQNGVFFAANRLYGITFVERHDLPVYHPDVRVFEIFDADGSPLALFLGDFYARDSKRGGAWMNAYVPQSGLFGLKAVVGNHQNIPKPAPGQPTLMSFDEVTTMFHEFGHALHGLFSDVQYPRFSGTSVPRDFVEYPSQVNEMWAAWPEVLVHYARHYQTGAVMPQALIDKLIESSQFNEGFKTTEYLAAALLDQRWHQLTPDTLPQDALDFEAQSLARAGVDFAPVPPRYRSTYFSHVFSGGYSAGYYAYIWAEVLDADTVEWFKENGGLTRANGERFRAALLSRGGSADAMQLYRAFRGRDPLIAPLLARRGLTQDSPGRQN